MINNFKKYLTTAGGRITCLRCTAMSKHTRLQCAKPALKISRTQKCGHHGGGPKSGKQSAEGRARIGAAHRVHGRETSQQRLERSQGALRMALIEDVMHVLRMTEAARTAGRKPLGYKPIKTLKEVMAWVVEDALDSADGGKTDA
jgi:hypothetical protein